MASLIFFLVACSLSCGVFADNIIGGEEVKPHSMPFMAFLFESKCGGILIDNDIVLTAAHCNKNVMTVMLGAHNIWAKERSVQKIKVCRRAPHPSYNGNGKGTDLMILKLEKKARPDCYVSPQYINQSPRNLPLRFNCSIAGWGKYATYNNQMSPYLRKLDLKVVPEKECLKSYPYYFLKYFVCAENSDKSKFTSPGDSGGPLLCGKYLQGIYHGRNEKGGPSLFTKVPPFIGWIKQVMKTIRC